MKTSLNGLFLTALSGLTASAFAAEPVNNDYWRISSNVYMELEKFEGHHNTNDRKVFDKTSMIGQLFLVNPESKMELFP